MILRPVRPQSPCGPPVTKRPVGLIRKRVSCSHSLGSTGRMISSITASMKLCFMVVSGGGWGGGGGGGVDQEARVVQPFFGQHGPDDFLDHRVYEALLHGGVGGRLVRVVLGRE